MKYYNFVNATIIGGLKYLGIHWPLPNLDILLPIGISFYTFMAVGYVVDVYRGNAKAESNFGIYALFISFFPQVTSGPIGRINQLIPQLKTPQILSYNNVMIGLKQILWGYFMKLCIADRLAIYVNAVFDNLEQHNGVTIFISSIFYSIQIYCDFAGYSLLAIGTARVMGIHLLENFRRPYFSQSVKEFWSRWHISLSTWFRDYVYIPLGGNRVSQFRHLLNLMITFIVSGLWHGANWTFIIWGMIHGTFQIIETLCKRYITFKIYIPSIVKILITFLSVNFAWIFFRASNIHNASIAFVKIFTDFGDPFINVTVFVMGIASLAILIIKEFCEEYRIHMKIFQPIKAFYSHSIIAFLIIYILLFGVLDGGQFIYFQF